MNKFEMRIPSALVHLRDGAVVIENSALQAALEDLKKRRISFVHCLYVFRDNEEDMGLLHIYKRLQECHILADRLKNHSVNVKISIGNDVETIYKQIIKYDCTIIYSTRNDPEIDEIYEQTLSENLRDFDLVMVDPIYSRNEKNIIPYWKKGFSAKDEATEDINFMLINSFLKDPRNIETEEELFQVAENLYYFFKEED